MRSCYLMFIEVRNRMLCLLLTAFFVHPCTSLNAQETDVKSGTVFPFFGVGIGFFHPGDVNDYIEASLPSNYIMEYGFTDLIMHVDLQEGVSLQFGSFNLQPYGAFSYAKAKDSQTLGDDFILDYTGGQIGVNLSFHSPVNHK